MTERLITDIGGLPAGEVQLEDRRLLFWEKQLMAVLRLVGPRVGISVDQFRRTVEEMAPDQYEKSEFYERRLDGWIDLFVKNNIVDPDDLERRTQDILARGTRDHVA